MLPLCTVANSISPSSNGDHYEDEFENKYFNCQENPFKKKGLDEPLQPIISNDRRGSLKQPPCQSIISSLQVDLPPLTRSRSLGSTSRCSSTNCQDHRRRPVPALWSRRCWQLWSCGSLPLVWPGFLPWRLSCCTAVRRHCTDWYEIWALTDHEIYYIKI